MSLEIVRQHFLENQLSAGDPVSGGQGRYQGESVRAITETSVVTDAARQSSEVVALPKATLSGLAQRIQKESTISTTALYRLLAEMPDLDKTALPQIFEFLGGLAALRRQKSDDRSEKLQEDDIEEDEFEEDEFEEDEFEEAWRRPGGNFHKRQGRRGSSDGGSYDEDENAFEQQIYQSLGKLGNTADKAAAIAVARGYFEAKDSDPRLTAALNMVAGEFYQLDEGAQPAQLAAAEEVRLAAATLETSPAAVRSRYRKRLREKTNFGELFEELAGMGLELGFLSLFTEIGADLAGVSLQSDRGYLRWLTVELKKLWQLKSVYDETKNLIHITESHLSKSDPRPAALKLTASLLFYCGKLTVSFQDAQSLLGALEKCSLESQLVFANALRDLHGRMPDGIWAAFTERLLQYNALGELCYRLTEAEERLYEESKGINR